MSNSVYSNARAKSLFNFLLNNDKINRMIDSKSVEEALKILSEINFGEGVIIGSVLDFEKLISAERVKLFEFINSSAPSQAVKQFFLLKNDYHNAEAFVKAKHLKINVDNLLTEDGILSKDFLKDCIMTDDYKKLPNEMATAVLKSDELFVNKTATGVSIGSLFEQGYFNNLIRVSKEDKTLLKILKAKIDCINVGICLRTRNFSEAKKMILNGGDISTNALKELCEEQFDYLREKFKFYDIREIVISAINSAEKGEPLSEFEKLADDFAIKHLLKFKYSVEGNLPYIQYCYYKLTDMYNVRIILVGLINNLSSESIRNRLRLNYEG